MNRRTPAQHAQRAAVADAAAGEGHDQDPQDLLLAARVQPTVICDGCGQGHEQGRAHICPGGAR